MISIILGNSIHYLWFVNHLLILPRPFALLYLLPAPVALSLFVLQRSVVRPIHLPRVPFPLRCPIRTVLPVRILFHCRVLTAAVRVGVLDPVLPVRRASGALGKAERIGRKVAAAGGPLSAGDRVFGLAGTRRRFVGAGLSLGRRGSGDASRFLVVLAERIAFRQPPK